MVCAKCAAKEAKAGGTSLAASDVWKKAGKNEERESDRRIGGNKLLQSKARMKAMPYMKPGSSSAGGSSASTSTSGISQCKKCKSKVAKVGAQYCQSCAYKDGICSQCGTIILANKSSYRMSSK